MVAMENEAKTESAENPGEYHQQPLQQVQSAPELPEDPLQSQPADPDNHDNTVAEEAPPEQAAEPEPRELTELEKYWKAVKDNPSDFTGWTYLLQYVEQEIKEDDLTSAREAFDAFLSKYPYCYGYWKKYADLEKKYNNVDKAEQVFEAALVAIPLSIDLWQHYLSSVSIQEEDPLQREERTRQIYERAITAAGMDFRSDKLWETYIQFEKDAGNLKKVTALYDRLLTIPTQLYSHNFECFTEHVNAHHPKDFLSLDEFLRLRQEVVPVVAPVVALVEPAGDEEGDTPADAVTETVADVPPGVEVPPGEEAPPGMDGDSFKGSEEETKAIREKVIELRRKVHKATEEEVSKRWAFEEGVRRPYFHVKPLERAQIKNWKDYLDFEIENSTHERVVVLFERCLIACALYEEFWLKYAKYMEPHSSEGVSHVFQRACQIHLPKKPNVHLAWAAFEERQGNHQIALDILLRLEVQLPGLAMVTLRKISLERRQGKFQETEQLYQSYIDNAEKTEVKSFYAIKYSRHLAKIIGNTQKAKDILEEALKRDENNHKLYLQLIDLEYLQTPVDEARMVRLFDMAIASDLAIEHRIAFSQRKLEFMEDFSANVTRVLDAYEEHQKLVKDMQNNKKRKSDDSTSEDAPSDKKAKVDTTYNNTTNGSSVDDTLAQQHQAATTAAMSTNTHHMQHQHQHHDPNAYHYNQWAGYGGYNNYQHPGWNAYNQGYYGQ